MNEPTFRCGHPRTPENSAKSGAGYAQCGFCKRVKNICRSAKRAQRRINAGKPLGRGPAKNWYS